MQQWQYRLLKFAFFRYGRYNCISRWLEVLPSSPYFLPLSLVHDYSADQVYNRRYKANYY
nr:MAG TPA_asm: hypothetical protein [Caudoviricetes sp.]